MPRNIEMKARCSDPRHQERLAAQIADAGPTTIEQRDTFYHAPRGRLKLRRLGDGTAQLIQYERADDTTARTSEYSIVVVSDAQAMHRCLERSLGVRCEVIKKRTLYMAGRTRIHFDSVEGLGDFVELEVVLRDGEDESSGHAEAPRLLQQLGIQPQHLVGPAYADLLAAASPAPPPARVHYAELTPSQFLERIRHAPVAYLPLGTLEWHGPHLPLGADGIQPTGLFEALARDVGGVVLPTLFVGPDCRRQIGGQDLIGMDTCPMPELQYAPQKFPGSAYWIDEQLFVRLLDSIMEQLARAGIRIVVGHGHGPSTVVFGRQAHRWRDQFGIESMTCWGAQRELGYMVDHAARNETSITMAVRPDLVHMANLPADGRMPDGVGGENPAAASREHGLAILAANIERMKGILSQALARLG